MNNFQQNTVAPGVQIVNSKKNKYRARKTVNGKRVTFYTNRKTEAVSWVNN